MGWVGLSGLVMVAWVALSWDKFCWVSWFVSFRYFSETLFSSQISTNSKMQP